MEENNPEIPKSIQEMEHNRWQIELLISGGLVFTLFQIPEYVNFKLDEAIVQSNFSTATAIIFVGVMILSRALLIGFSVNLLLRSLWLAYVGIYFSYPKGIDYERLKYSKTFEEKFKKENNYINRIISLEKYSSLSYSLAILISIMSVGILVILWITYQFLIIPFFPTSIVESELIIYILFAALIFISFGALDRIVFGLFGENEKLNQIFYPISKLISWLNLTWILKYEWTSLISNTKRWKLHLLSNLYFVVAVVISLSDLGLDTFVSSNFNLNPLDERRYKNIPMSGVILDNDEYDDQLGNQVLIKEASIVSENIHSNFLPVFIVYDQYMDSFFEYQVTKDSIVLDYSKIRKRSTMDRNGEAIRKILNDAFLVKLNGVKKDSIRWFYRNHAITKQEGFHAKIDISALPNGLNELDLYFLGSTNDQKTDTMSVRWIPFWKEVYFENEEY